MEIDIPVERVRTGEPDIIAFRVPDQARGPLMELFRTGDNFRMKLGRPFRRRSTGPHSQNHRINGFIAQISQATQIPFDGLKEWLKLQSIAEGYPYVMLPTGEVLGQSETKLSVEEASIYIGTIERIAAEWNIPLVE